MSTFKTILEEIEEQDDTADKMAQSTEELLQIHYKLGHMSFAKIRFTAAIGWWEPKLAKRKIHRVYIW